MGLRSQRPRISKNYIIENINGVQYFIEPATYVSKNVIYQAKKKLSKGLISAPIELLISCKTILVVCEGNGKFNFINLQLKPDLNKP